MQTQVSHPQADVMLGSTPLSVPVLLPVAGTDEDADLLSGAALAGAVGVISAGMIHRDPATHFWKGKVSTSPMMARLVQHYRRYDRGVGQLVVQVDRSDDRLGVPEYVISILGVTALEFIFRAAADGFPEVRRVDSLAAALRQKKSGNRVLPDPEDPQVQACWEAGEGQYFRVIGQDSSWEPEALEERLRELRALGLQHVYFRIEDEAEQDQEAIRSLAKSLGAELVSLDHAPPLDAAHCRQAEPVSHREHPLHLVTLCPNTVRTMKEMEPYANAEGCMAELRTIYGEQTYISHKSAACCAMLRQISRMEGQ